MAYRNTGFESHTEYSNVSQGPCFNGGIVMDLFDSFVGVNRVQTTQLRAVSILIELIPLSALKCSVMMDCIEPCTRSGALGFGLFTRQHKNDSLGISQMVGVQMKYDERAELVDK